MPVESRVRRTEIYRKSILEGCGSAISPLVRKGLCPCRSRAVRHISAREEKGRDRHGCSAKDGRVVERRACERSSVSRAASGSFICGPIDWERHLTWRKSAGGQDHMLRRSRSWEGSKNVRSVVSCFARKILKYSAFQRRRAAMAVISAGLRDFLKPVTTDPTIRLHAGPGG